MSAEFQSVSTIPIKIGLNQALEVEGELKRHLSPLTVKKLLEVFPIYGRINSYEGRFIYIQVGLQIGSEKPVNTFKKGDIPPFWDGHSTERILEHCLRILSIRQPA